MTALEIIMVSISSTLLLIIVLAIIVKKVFDGYCLKKQDEYALMVTYSKKNGVVFLGDSLTEMYNVNEFFPNNQIHNRGISANTTADVLKRLQTSVIELEPKKIFLLIGINDLGKRTTPARVFDNITKIIEQITLKLPNTILYVESLLPVNKTLSLYSKIAVSRRKNKDIIAVNNLLENYCAANNITFIITAPFFTDEKGNLKKNLTAEGLHLNLEGYQILTKILMPYVLDKNEKEQL